jgi:O-antigen/teichoic acid export membrane protein
MSQEETRLARFAARLAALPVVGRFLGGDPLLRNGVLLTTAALATSVLGAAYWSLAGLRYEVDTVGRNYSAISMMTFLAGVSQLNLSDVLIRFVPSAGTRTKRIIGNAYLASLAMALVTATVFVIVIPWVSPALGFLHDRFMGPAFILATVCYAIFVVQDGALTGLRRPTWVLAENALFSVAKLIAVFALVRAGGNGIMLSWVVALLISLAFTNTYLFGFAVPRRVREAHRFARRPSWARDPRPEDVTGALAVRTESTQGVVRFTALTYFGGLFWLGASTLPQVLLLNTLGPRASAFFSISWVITTMLMVISTNMGASIVVESAGDLARLGSAARTVLRHTGGLLVGAAAVLVLAAPLVLRVFGEDYPEHATTLLRLLALSTVPNLVMATALAAARVQRRAGMVMAIYITVSAMVFGGALVFVPRMGLSGMGMAWLTAQTLMATALLLLRRTWLPAAGASTMPAGPYAEADRRRVGAGAGAGVRAGVTAGTGQGILDGIRQGIGRIRRPGRAVPAGAGESAPGASPEPVGGRPADGGTEHEHAGAGAGPAGAARFTPELTADRPASARAPARRRRRPDPRPSWALNQDLVASRRNSRER